MKNIKAFRSMVVLAMVLAPTLCLAQEKAGPDLKVVADTNLMGCHDPQYDPQHGGTSMKKIEAIVKPF